MADQSNSSPQTSGLAGDKVHLGYDPYAPTHRPNWTDSFPHSFHGWGPQTPDPDEQSEGHEAERVRFADELTWDAGKDDQGHIVWRYSGRTQRT